MSKVVLWLSTMRLRTLPLSVSGIILASALAEYNGCFRLDIFILSILTTLSFQILSNLANDYGDGVKGTDNNERVGPQRAIQSGKISPDEMFNAIRINILICIALSIFLIFAAFGVKHFLLTILFFILGIASILAALRYTIGDKAYGYRALGDIFVFIFFGLLSVMGCYVLYAKTFDHVVVLPACTIGLLSVAVLNLNNMRDLESDKQSGKITMAVKLGAKRIKSYHFFIVISAMILSALFGFLYFTDILNLIFVITYIPLIVHLNKVSKVSDLKLLDPELKKLAFTTFFLAVLMAIGHLL